MNGSPLVLFEKRERVAMITLNRPEKLNALNQSLYEELEAAMKIANDDYDVRALVLTGAGRCFSTGADIAGGGMEGGVSERWKAYQSLDQRQFSLWDVNKPIVGAVHGYCLGRGLELALWCDIVVASEDARLGQPEVRQGSFVSSIVPWLIGIQRSKLFMLTGDQIDAREAERIGLVARVVPSGQALSEAFKLAQCLTHIPPITAQSIKQWINGIYKQMGLPSVQVTGAAFSALISSMTTPEKGTEELERIRLEKGFKAFLEARDAPFKK
jgi:enoyl-CoA hydratase/carnithine racemase